VPARDCKVQFAPDLGVLVVVFHVAGEEHHVEIPASATAKWNRFANSLPQWDIKTDDDDSVIEKDRAEFVSELEEKGMSEDDAEAVAEAVERFELTDE